MSLPIEPVLGSCLKRTLFQISVPSISEKGNSHCVIVKSIRRKSPGMLSDGAIFLNGNTHTARKTPELPQNFKWEVGSYFKIRASLIYKAGGRFVIELVKF
ncbi:hypothetical protein AVEN_48682-1 [Araneus ventricosus]|uniref:Uncharacterized protein n=1 Tax=Araneus ventricosus TaxID=182803 RepID=A0A4Y2G0J7_ARAVE|nr:hypothetical protein AVEN_48682-1 [Araneus ventricosus]